MGMKIIVVSFEKNKNKELLADYKSISNEVNITEFLNIFLQSTDIIDLEVLEEDEKIIYQEIKSSSIKSISIQLDKRGKNIFSSIKKTSGNKKRNEFLDNLEDIFYLNILLKKFFQELLLNNENNIKLIII